MDAIRRLGVCYYPEHWPEEMWARDAARMVETGLSIVRIGEFAWSRIEPEPGRLDWAWLDRAVETLHAAGLEICMGTPTATPPRWMLDRHPDMLAHDGAGRVRRFGSRRHYDFSHDGYRGEAVRIAQAMGARYGTHPGVASWQIDNEYGCHDTVLSWSPAAASAFRLWLKARYGTIARLNAAWGNVFWSMDYARFDQIDPPNLTVTEPNPAHAMDFRRFSSDQVVRFNRAQAEVLRECAPGRAILHNYMGRITQFDHFTVGADLDIAAWDSYPLGFLEDRIEADEAHKRRFARQGDPDFQAFHHDLYRAVGRAGHSGEARWWVMEQQPGPVNWAPHNPAPLPGMVRLWSWEAFAHGAEAVCYFRWRQAPFAQEQMHAGLLRPDDAPADGLAEAARVASEIAALPQVERARSSVALVFDYASDWAWRVQPQDQDFAYFDLVLSAYRALRRLGLSVDILPPSLPDAERYALVLVPGLMHWTDAARAALARAEAAGTRLVVGPRAGSRTANFRIPDAMPPDLPGLLDVKVASVETLRPDMTVDAGAGAIRTWRERLEIGPRATPGSIAADGHPVTARQGGLTYLAGRPDDTLWVALLEPEAEAAGLTTHRLPDHIRIRDAGPHRFVFNHSADMSGHDVSVGDLVGGEAGAPPASVGVHLKP